MNVCRSSRRWRATISIALAIIATSLGCSRAKHAPAPSRVTSDGLTLTYSAGLVIDGEQIDHDFEITNRLHEPIFIEDDDDDIEKTCGCARLETAARHLEAGDKTTIRMAVNTTGKHGRFRVAGTIRWHEQTVNTGQSTCASRGRPNRFCW